MKIGIYKSTALAVLLIAGLAPIASAQTKPAVELEGAIAKEQTTGDLKAAIATYQKIAANSAAPRDVRAKALLHLAACYEKQGRQAQGVYQQIVREYADQPAAKQATAKLAALGQGDRETTSRAASLRKVDVPASLAGIPLTYFNTDGRRAVYVDRLGTLTSADLASGETRVVLKPKVGTLSWEHTSRDMSMVFVSQTMPDGKASAVLMRTDGTGYREIPGTFTGRPEWSWDNRYLIACMGQPDGTRKPVRIAAADGSILSLRGTAPCLQFFSPDGRFLASNERGGTLGPIRLGPATGGEQRVVFENGQLFGWTRDGRYLVMKASHSGAEGLYLLPITDGKPDGEPILIRAGSFLYGGVNSDGSLLFEQNPEGGQFAAWLGDLRQNGQVAAWTPLSLRSSLHNPHSPAWSPDSSQFAYVTSNKQSGQDTQSVLLRNVATGAERELYTAGPGDMYCVWPKKRPDLYCSQIMPQGTTDLLSISFESGQAEHIGSVPGRNHVLFAGADDQSLYLGSDVAWLMRWDRATGQTAMLGQGRGTFVYWVTASPDGRWISQVDKGRTEIRSVSGGDWQPLPIYGQGTEIAFTPDGNWLLYHELDAAGRDSLFRVATAGGQPERIGDFPATTRFGHMWISPDGRKVVADTQKAREVWVLENFEPKQ